MDLNYVCFFLTNASHSKAHLKWLCRFFRDLVPNTHESNYPTALLQTYFLTGREIRVDYE